MAGTEGSTATESHREAERLLVALEAQAKQAEHACAKLRAEVSKASSALQRTVLPAGVGVSGH